MQLSALAEMVSPKTCRFLRTAQHDPFTLVRNDSRRLLDRLRRDPGGKICHRLSRGLIVAPQRCLVAAETLVSRVVGALRLRLITKQLPLFSLSS
jgi:hypothetical protein